MTIQRIATGGSAILVSAPTFDATDATDVVTSPTVAAGDAQISFDEGSTWTNTANAPVAELGRIAVNVSAAELTVGTNASLATSPAIVRFRDASGGQWMTQFVEIYCKGDGYALGADPLDSSGAQSAAAAALAATDAIDADSISAAAVLKMQTVIGASSTPAQVVQGIAEILQDTGETIPTILSNLAATDLIVQKIPNDLAVDSSGRVTVGSVATNAIDGDAIATSAVTEFQSGLLTTNAFDTKIPENIALTPAGQVTVGSISTDAINGNAIANNAVTALQAGLLTASDFNAKIPQDFVFADIAGTQAVVTWQIGAGTPAGAGARFTGDDGGGADVVLVRAEV